VRLHGSDEHNNWLMLAYVNNALNEEAILSRKPASGRYPDGYALIVAPKNLGVSVI
jgi:hypothetical protein